MSAAWPAASSVDSAGAAAEVVDSAVLAGAAELEAAPPQPTSRLAAIPAAKRADTFFFLVVRLLCLAAFVALRPVRAASDLLPS